MSDRRSGQPAASVPIPAAKFQTTLRGKRGCKSQTGNGRWNSLRLPLEASIARAFIPVLPLIGTGLTLLLYYLTGAQVPPDRAETTAEELAGQRERLR